MKPSLGDIRIASVLLAIVSHMAGVAAISTLSPDPRLLSLVPPDSQIIAGMRSLPHDRQAVSLLLITPTNSLDLADFFAITGSDESRVISQVIFTVSRGHDGKPPGHSLLVSGHFDQARLLRVARSDSTVSQYHGASVFVIPPFDRELGFFKETRLLAIIDSHVALFGTEAIVKQELDRHAAGITPDSSILVRLEHLREKDDSWCLLSRSALGKKVSLALSRLDPTLAEMVEKSSAFQFGIRFGRQVELDYQIDMIPSQSDEDPISSLNQPLDGRSTEALSFLPLLPTGFAAKSDTELRGVVKMPRSRYEQWLAELNEQGRSPFPLHPREKSGQGRILDAHRWRSEWPINENLPFREWNADD